MNIDLDKDVVKSKTKLKYFTEETCTENNKPYGKMVNVLMKKQEIQYQKLKKIVQDNNEWNLGIVLKFLKNLQFVS